MATKKQIALKLMAGEVSAVKAMDPDEAAQAEWWAGLVGAVLDALDQEQDRAANAIIDFFVDEEE